MNNGVLSVALCLCELVHAEISESVVVTDISAMDRNSKLVDQPISLRLLR